MTPLFALMAYVFWTLTLVAVLGGSRALKVLMGRNRSTDWPRNEVKSDDWMSRLRDAHLNATENLPIFATVVIVGFLVGDGGSTVDTLAWLVVAARVVQTSVHVFSVSEMAINVRFTFFGAQIGCFFALAISATLAMIR